jgi:hypothetical protein
MSLRGSFFAVMDSEAKLSCPGELLRWSDLLLSCRKKIVILTVTAIYGEVHRERERMTDLKLHPSISLPLLAVQLIKKCQLIS